MYGLDMFLLIFFSSFFAFLYLGWVNHIAPINIFVIADKKIIEYYKYFVYCKFKFEEFKFWHWI